MAIAQPPIYQEVYYFLASASTHEQILAFRPSQMVQERIRTLLEASKLGQLTIEGQAELDEFEQVEHFVRMLKSYVQELCN